MNRCLVRAQSSAKFLQPKVLFGDVERPLDERTDREPVHVADYGKRPVPESIVRTPLRLQARPAHERRAIHARAGTRMKPQRGPPTRTSARSARLHATSAANIEPIAFV